MIKAGVKTLEGRIGYSSMKRIKAGSTILLLTGDRNQWERNRKNFPSENVLPLKVIAARTYKNFEEALTTEKTDKLLPGYNAKNALSLYSQIFSPDKIKKYGVIILEFQVIGQK